jgi:hypothetical protein
MNKSARIRILGNRIKAFAKITDAIMKYYEKFNDDLSDNEYALIEMSDGINSSLIVEQARIIQSHLLENIKKPQFKGADILLKEVDHVLRLQHAMQDEPLLAD